MKLQIDVTYYYYSWNAIICVGPDIPHSVHVSDPGISANLFAKRYQVQVQTVFWKKFEKHLHDKNLENFPDH